MLDKLWHHDGQVNLKFGADSWSLEVAPNNPLNGKTIMLSVTLYSTSNLIPAQPHVASIQLVFCVDLYCTPNLYGEYRFCRFWQLCGWIYHRCIRASPLLQLEFWVFWLYRRSRRVGAVFAEVQDDDIIYHFDWIGQFISLSLSFHSVTSHAVIFSHRTRELVWYCHNIVHCHNLI